MFSILHTRMQNNHNAPLRTSHTHACTRACYLECIFGHSTHAYSRSGPHASVPPGLNNGRMARGDCICMPCDVCLRGNACARFRTHVSATVVTLTHAHACCRFCVGWICAEGITKGFALASIPFNVNQVAVVAAAAADAVASPAR